LPPGIGIRNVSSAPNAFLRNSMHSPAPRTTRYGVMVWYPSGMGLTAMATSFGDLRRVPSYRRRAAG
jgi:hypothetical protein